MDISIKLNKNFTTAFNRMLSEYGEEMAKINGFSDQQLSYTDFIDNFIDTDTVADASIDGNSNVGRKDIVTLINEMPKPHQKLLAFNKIYYEINKEFGFKDANDWLRAEWDGHLYMHDANTTSFVHYFSSDTRFSRCCSTNKKKFNWFGFRFPSPPECIIDSCLFGYMPL